MLEKKTTTEDLAKRGQYTKAVTIPGINIQVTTSEAIQQRTVVTRMTEGVVSLRYAPHTPKPADPVDTTS